MRSSARQHGTALYMLSRPLQACPFTVSAVCAINIKLAAQTLKCLPLFMAHLRLSCLPLVQPSAPAAATPRPRYLQGMAVWMPGRRVQVGGKPSQEVLRCAAVRSQACDSRLLPALLMGSHLRHHNSPDA